MRVTDQIVLSKPFRTRLAVWFGLRQDVLISGLFGLGSLGLYAATAAPSVSNMFDDNLEFQVVIPTLGIPHPTGYPLFTMLAHPFVTVLPWRDPAGRANLVSALAAAAAVAMFYLLVHELTQSRPAAALASVAFALSPTWWTQATRADVYTAHGLLVAAFLYLLLRWERAFKQGQPDADRWLVGAALIVGLGLVHQRMFVLLLPVALVFVLWTDIRLLNQPGRWLRPLLLVLAPLPLYLYLPLRGQVLTSLDGTYQPTLAGTLDWITARAYNVFLTGNPFNLQRDAAFFLGQFREQLGLVLLATAILGLATAWRVSPRRYTLLLVATAAQIGFGVAYKVEDIGSFLLAAFQMEAIWAALGAAFVITWLRRFPSRPQPTAHRPRPKQAMIALVAVLLLVEPLLNAIHAYPSLNLSHDWGTYDLGQDMISSLAPNGEVVGLLGETALVRYFRDVLGQRPDVRVAAADAEPARFAAVDAALQRGQPVYLTRDLPGAAQRYSLHAVGPLIAVRQKAWPASAPDGQEIGAGILLVASQTVVRQTHDGAVLRVALTAQVRARVDEDLKVSARLLDQAGATLAQVDQVPVHFAYPTSARVAGERVQDIYDLPLPTKALPAGYQTVLILYRAANGAEVGRLTL